MISKNFEISIIYVENFPIMGLCMSYSMVLTVSLIIWNRVQLIAKDYQKSYMIIILIIDFFVFWNTAQCVKSEIVKQERI